MLALVRSSSYLLMPVLVGSFSYTPLAGSRAQSVVLVRSSSYTPAASFSNVRSFPYTLDASLREEFYFHSSCLVLVRGFSYTCEAGFSEGFSYTPEASSGNKLMWHTWC